MYLQTLLHYGIPKYLNRKNRMPVVVHPERLKNMTKGPLLIVANHVRAMDPFYIGTVLPFSLFPLRFLVARWFRTPLLQFFALVGIIPLLSRAGSLITVKHGKGIAENIRPAVEALRAGGVVGIFPEGKRNLANEELQPFKQGAAAMAYASKAPVLPLFITFSDPATRRATIIVGEQFYIETPDYAAGTAIIRQKIRALADESM